jgi:hypothetical protein
VDLRLPVLFRAPVELLATAAGLPVAPRAPEPAQKPAAAADLLEMELAAISTAAAKASPTAAAEAVA